MSRELLQQALDALESTASIVDSYYIERGKQYTPECDAAVTALRQALAAPQAEPVGKVLAEGEMIGYDRRGGDVIWWNKPPGPAMLYATPPAPQASPVPDGMVMVPRELLRQLRHYTDCYLTHWPDCGAPTEAEIDAELAASPAAPVVPLTDEQIDKILERERMKWATSPPTYEFAASFARAIEAAHGITGGSE